MRVQEDETSLRVRVRVPSARAVATYGTPLAVAPLVPRPRLLDRLDRAAGAAGAALTVVRAPAGYGKTTLVSQWVADGRPPGPVLRATLEPGDREAPGRLWSRLRRGPGLPDPAGSGPSHRPADDPDAVLDVAAAARRLGRPVVVVLDEADVPAGSDRLAADLDLLVRRSGTDVRLVVLARTAAGLPLERYALSGLLCEIGPDELAFTADEVAALLAAHGVRAPAVVAETLRARTGGWAGGVRTLCEELRDRGPLDDRPVVGGRDGAVPGRRRRLADYLQAEVLAPLAPDLRELLADVSVADHAEAGLAVRLTGRADAPSVLDDLTRGNVLLGRCEQHAECWRLNPLLADLLRAELGRADRGRAARAHVTAAGWAVRRRDPAGVGHHLEAAGGAPAAVALAVDSLPLDLLLGRGAAPELAPVVRLLETRPDDPVHRCLLVLDAAGRRDLRWLARDGHGDPLPRAAGARPGQRATDRLLAVVARSAAARVSGEGSSRPGPPTPAAADDRPAAAPAPSVLAAHAFERATTLLRDGDVAQAARALAAVETDDDWSRAHVLAQLALCEALDGRLDRAEWAAAAGDAAADAAGLAVAARPRATAAALAWVASERVEPGPARRAADAAEHRTATVDGIAEAVVRQVRVRLLRRHEGPSAATALLLGTGPGRAVGREPGWLRQRFLADWAAYEVAHDRAAAALPVLGDVDPGDASPWAALVLARADVAGGRSRRAVRGLEPLLRLPSADLGCVVDAWVLLAAAALAEGDRGGAREALTTALAVAAPVALRRPFVEAPEEVRALLRSSYRHGSTHAWLCGDPEPLPAPRRDPGAGQGRAVTRSQAPPRSDGTLLVEQLTEREHEVLVLLADLLTTQEVATALFLSVNTVKTHIRSILRKLAAANRNEAVRRARQLKIIGAVTRGE